MTAEGWRVSAQRIALDSIFKTAKAQVILSRHSERSEAIHFAATQEAGLLRRFRLRSLSYGGQVAPRNDVQAGYGFAFPRREAPEFCMNRFAQRKRGRGECRAPNAPTASRANV
jgi:hypothetical protein